MTATMFPSTAFEYGYQAFLMRDTQCPYAIGTPGFDAWAKGYAAARKEWGSRTTARTPAENNCSRTRSNGALPRTDARASGHTAQANVGHPGAFPSFTIRGPALNESAPRVRESGQKSGQPSPHGREKVWGQTT